jgi:hypothetical protein
MLMTENQFSIRRPLHETSIAQVHEAMENLPPKKVMPRADRGLGLTLVERSFISRNMNRSHIHSAQSRYNHIFRPIVRSSLEQQNVRVNDVRYFGHNLGRISLALVLDDAEGILDNEHTTYSKRIRALKEIGSIAFIPHITVGSIPHEHATSTLLSALESNMPDTVTLQPVRTKDPQFLPYTMQEAINLHNGILPPPKPTPVSSESHHESFKLPHILPHPIAFLKSLRNERESDDNLIQ